MAASSQDPTVVVVGDTADDSGERAFFAAKLAH
jgi:hypothetical protein